MTYKKFLVAADNHGSLVSEEAKKKILNFANMEAGIPCASRRLGELLTTP